MKGTWTIFRRELAGLFLAPLAWVLLCLALALNGFYFIQYLVAWNGLVNPALRLALGGSTPYWALMLLMPPLLTMRMISEESRSGVLEFLLTAPVTDAAVVVGKLLAATCFMALLWSSALAYALLLQQLGAAPDWGAVSGGLVGSVLASALYCAIGLAASALTSTPLIAAFVAMVANLALFSVRLLRQVQAAPAGHWSEDLLRHFDVVTHLEGSFVLGVIDTAHVVYLLGWTFVFVFLAIRLVEARRWS